MRSAKASPHGRIVPAFPCRYKNLPVPVCCLSCQGFTIYSDSVRHEQPLPPTLGVPGGAREPGRAGTSVTATDVAPVAFTLGLRFAARSLLSRIDRARPS